MMIYNEKVADAMQIMNHGADEEMLKLIKTEDYDVKHAIAQYASPEYIALMVDYNIDNTMDFEDDDTWEEIARRLPIDYIESKLDFFKKDNNEDAKETVVNRISAKFAHLFLEQDYANVRLAAVKRCEDVSAIFKVLQNETCKEVFVAMTERLVELREFKQKEISDGFDCYCPVD